MTIIRSSILLIFGLFIVYGAKAQAIGGVVNRLAINNTSIIATGTNTVAQTLANFYANQYYAAVYGIVADGLILPDMTLTNSSSIISSASHTFVAADVGATCVVSDVITGPIDPGLTTTISSIGTGGNAGKAILADNWTNSTQSGNGLLRCYHTDNTTAFATALAALKLNYPSGAKLVLSRGVYAASQISLFRQQQIVCGDGVGACVVLQTAGANKNFITVEGYSTNAGTQNQFGTNAGVPSFFGIDGIHVDGNGYSQTSGGCIAFFGNAESITNYDVENCYGDNIHIESSILGAYNNFDWRAQEESIVSHGVSRNSLHGKGLYNCAHDSVITDYRAFYNQSDWAYYADSTANCAGSAQVSQIHTYVNGHGQYYGATSLVEGAYIDFDDMEIGANASGSRITTYTTACGYLSHNCITIDSGAFRVQLTANLEWYSGATGGVKGVNIASGGGGDIIKVSGSGISPSGQVTLIYNNSSFNDITFDLQNAATTNSTCLYLGGTYNVVHGTGFNCYNFLDLTADGGNNIINYAMYKGSGTNYILSAIPASDTLIAPNDSGTGTQWQFPGTITTNGTGLSKSGATLNSNAVYQISFQPGLLTSVTNTKSVFGKISKTSTVDNIEGSALLFTCVGNPTVTFYECGTSATCASSPTTIGSVTVTTTGTVVDGTISNATITAGDYVAWAISSGTCTSLDIAATAQIHSN